MVGKALVTVNNLSVRLRSPKCRGDEMLILVPSCLQSSKCTQKVTVDVANCRRCGNCAVGAILDLAERFGVRVACATGGRLALSMVKDDRVKVVVAVACEKELRAGIIGAFPKPVSAIPNVRPHGPCKDTDVDMEEVRAAIERLLVGEPSADEKQEPT